MAMNPRLLRPRQTGGFTPRSISGLALWLDAADSSTLYTTDAGPVTAVSSPLDIAGCALWLDGADSSDASMTLSGTNVSAWRDKSGNGRDFTSTGTARPTLTSAAINGRSALSFDGVDDRLSTSAFISSGTSGMTVFVVARGTFPGTGSFLFTHRSASGGVDSNDLAIGWSANWGSSWSFGTLRSRVTSLRSSVSYTADRRFDSVDVSGVGVSTVTASFGATSSSNSHRWQGSEASSTSGTSDGGALTGMAIGHRFNATPDLFYTGAIAEVIVFNTALSSTDRARVEAYLAAKWGISGVHAPATATNDPVGAWLDKSGNGRHATQATGASRPTTAPLGGRNSLTFIGAGSSSPRLDGPTLSQIADTTNNVLVAFFVARFTGTTNVTNRCWSTADAWQGGGGFGWFPRYSNGQAYFDAPEATARVNGVVTGTTITTGPTVCRLVRSGASASMHYNAAQVSARSNASGAISSNPSNATRIAGPDAGNTFTISELLAYSRALSPAEIQAVERYLAAKYGVSLAPQVSNADAQGWVNRVYAAGGTVSATTAEAVNAFCNAIDAAGIRDRFYRLNLFCGNSDANLAAVRTPLFRGPSLGGTQYGNATDTNVNFVQGDYAETGASGGLIGNGSSKYLQTGLQTSAWITGGNVRSHLAVYKVTNTAMASSGVMISSRPASGGLPWELGAGGNAVGAGSFPLPTPTDSLLGVTLESDTSVIGFRNSVFNSPVTPSTTITSSLTPFTIFCRNGPSNDGNTHSPAFYSNQRLAAYSIGAGLTQPQVLAFNNAMQAFQTALGRNV